MDPNYVVGGNSPIWDVPPRLVSGDAPPYPIELLFKREQGSATIQFNIDVDGTTSDFATLRTDNKYFAVHAIYAVKSWKFSPAQKDGKPIACRLSQTFQFGDGK